MADHVGWEGLATNVAAFQTPVGFISDDFTGGGGMSMGGLNGDTGDMTTAFATGFGSENDKGASVDDYILQYQAWSNSANRDSLG